MAFVQYVIHWWHCTLGVISHISKYSMFPMLLVISFDFSRNGVERLILFQVGLQRFFIRIRLELTNQLLDCFLADVILLLDSRMGQSSGPEVSFTGTTFVVRSIATGFSVLARMVEGRSRVRGCSVLASMRVMEVVEELGLITCERVVHRHGAILLLIVRGAHWV